MDEIHLTGDLARALKETAERRQISVEALLETMLRETQAAAPATAGEPVAPALHDEAPRLRRVVEFVREAAHDLRTSLSTLNISVYLFKKVDDPARQTLALEAIRDQIAYLHELANGLNYTLSLETLERFELAPADLNALVTQATRLTDKQAAEKGLSFTCTLDTNLPPVRVSQNHLHHALSHLIRNALIYTATGSVAITTERQGDYAAVVVRDTGVGIDPDDMPHIFKRFYKASRRSGVGLGLSTALRIAEMHGGRIEVESKVGQGSTFRLLLPLPPKPPAPLDLPEAAASLEDTQPTEPVNIPADADDTLSEKPAPPEPAPEIIPPTVPLLPSLPSHPAPTTLGDA